ncbi:MAG: trypsin-like peptidase domain-containing protein [Phycisphaerae bacterium]
MSPATYAVVIEFKDPRLKPAFTGTAFAIGGHLLATNGHVADAVTKDAPSPVKRILAVQSGTGAVVTLLRSIPHPSWDGTKPNSYSSLPDVALFTTLEALPATLPLATDAQVADLAAGNPVYLMGFPGDVNEQFAPVIPGETKPQATGLPGAITALRTYDLTVAATPANADMIQHQSGTSGGTSGSPVVRCGLVVGVHNSATYNFFISGFNSDGSAVYDRSPAASNNFGVHVRHLRALVELFESQAVVGTDLPAAFDKAAPFAGSYQAGVSQGQRVHQFQFTVQANGEVKGTATWGQNKVELTGLADAFGNLLMWDQLNPIGIYVGRMDAQTGQAAGTYAEGGFENKLGNWTGSKGGTTSGAATGGNSGGSGSSNANVGALAGSYSGSIPSGQRKHSFQFTVSSSGQVSGTATWGQSVFKLTGKVDANGKLAMIDDGEQYQVPVGIYVGTINAQTGQAAGAYAEGNVENVLNQWTAARGSGSNTGGSNTGGGNSGNTSNQGVSFRGTVMSDQLPHTIQFTVSNGKITGTSTWGSVRYNLTGSVDNNLNLRMQDDDPQYPGVYVGTINIQTLQASGVFGINGNVYGQWVAQAQ